MLAAAAILASAAMGALYVRGGHAWLLGFVFLVPWLRALDAPCHAGRHAAARLGHGARLHGG
ncbi:hypothetical protein LP420_39490 [Massilia sp. B-10]|nr:hypothetical protein LP420_39490 [Massilia sp. B-10]